MRIKTNGEEGDELKETGAYFKSSRIGGSITNPYSREYKTTIFVFSGAKIDVNSRIEKEIAEAKNHHH